MTTNRNSYLKRKYGITEEQYEELLLAQAGKCAICLCKPRTRRLAVDHNHKTGEIRGLLCSRCNHGLLGHAHDSIPVLERALEYLRNPPAKDFFNGRNDNDLYSDGQEPERPTL